MMDVDLKPVGTYKVGQVLGSNPDLPFECGLENFFNVDDETQAMIDGVFGNKPYGFEAGDSYEPVDCMNSKQLYRIQRMMEKHPDFDYR